MNIVTTIAASSAIALTALTGAQAATTGQPTGAVLVAERCLNLNGYDFGELDHSEKVRQNRACGHSLSKTGLDQPVLRLPYETARECRNLNGYDFGELDHAEKVRENKACGRSLSVTSLDADGVMEVDVLYAIDPHDLARHDATI